MAAVAVILDWNDFTYFWSTISSDTSFQVWNQIAFWFKEPYFEKKIKMAAVASILNFRSEWFYSFFELRVTLMLPTKFTCHLAFWFRRRSLNRFSKWRIWQPFWISARNDFSYFLSITHSDTSFRANGFSTEEKLKTDFQDGDCDGGLEFPIGTILALVKSSWYFLPNFESIWHFGSGEKVYNRFSRWWPWRPFWIFNRNDFTYILSTSQPYNSYQVSSQLSFLFRRTRSKQNFKIVMAILDFRLERLYLFFICNESHPGTSYQVSSQLAMWFRRRSSK